jgi:formylglycine-generating enzyme required for sulfatase activity
MKHLVCLFLMIFSLSYCIAQNEKGPFNIEMVLVDGGTFTMGCEDVECDGFSKPAHSVTLSSYYIGKYEVTQAQWKSVMGSIPSGQPNCENCPVTKVDRREIEEFIKKLNNKSGKRYRLPTEAQWEFAARGGKKGLGFKYSGSNNIDAVAWHFDNSEKKTQPVGQKQANELGVHDMSGNVSEFCSDYPGNYSSKSRSNPGYNTTEDCVIRGGSILSESDYAFIFNRQKNHKNFYKMPDHGFRLALSTEKDSFEMVLVNGGTFMMGCTDADCSENQKPCRKITLKSYYIGKYEVTLSQWYEIMGENPSYPVLLEKGPVQNVSWNDVQRFIAELNKKTGKRYRLPTEAEWEFAARGGIKSQGFKYSGSDNVVEVSYYEEISTGRLPSYVGYSEPNELDIYDMSGNVAEWCSDWYGEYSNINLNNPSGPLSGSLRVIRGGSWNQGDYSGRVTCRDKGLPERKSSSVGFRLVLEP